MRTSEHEGASVARPAPGGPAVRELESGAHEGTARRTLVVALAVSLVLGFLFVLVAGLASSGTVDLAGGTMGGTSESDPPSTTAAPPAQQGQAAVLLTVGAVVGERPSVHPDAVFAVSLRGRPDVLSGLLDRTGAASLTVPADVVVERVCLTEPADAPPEQRCQSPAAPSSVFSLTFSGRR